MKEAARGLVVPVGKGLARIGLTANAVTLIGLLFAFATAGLASVGERRLAFACLVVSSLCDLIDGAVARAGGGGTRFGAALDSVVDRAGEAAILTGVLVAALRQGAQERFVWVWSIALAASFLVSYVRARAEGLGMRCEVGLLERPERLALLSILLLAGPRWGEWILAVLAALGTFTVLQRLLHVRRVSMERGTGSAP
jgi:CDP-diacylglycerol--glycerol-3-phosphate 3-phosphatidyltransferase